MCVCAHAHACMHVHVCVFILKLIGKLHCKQGTEDHRQRCFLWKKTTALKLSDFESENPLSTPQGCQLLLPQSPPLLKVWISLFTAFTHIHYNNLHAFMTWRKSSVCKIQKYVSKCTYLNPHLWVRGTPRFKFSSYTTHHAMHERNKQVRITKDSDSIWKNLDTPQKNPKPLQLSHANKSDQWDLFLHICMLADIWWKIKRLHPHLPTPYLGLYPCLPPST